MDKSQIEKECYSLEDSKAKLLELVHRHFENKAEPCSFTLDEIKQELTLSQKDYRAGRVHTVAELRKRHTL